LTIVVALSAMVFLSIAVMMLKARPLAYAVQAFIVFQELASVSVQGVKDLPRFKDELTMVATYANMVSQRRKDKDEAAGSGGQMTGPLRAAEQQRAAWALLADSCPRVCRTVFRSILT
jgi:hypothetical protein